MTAHLIAGRWLAVLTVLAIAVALAACSGDAEPEAADTPAPEPEPAAAEAADPAPESAAADEPAPAATEAAEADEAADPAPESAAADESPATQAEPSGAEVSISVDGDTTWGDVFDTLAPFEQACIRGALGDDLLASALSEPVLSEDDSEQWLVDLFSCLSERTARDVYYSVLVAGLGVAAGTLSADQQSCLRAVVDELDVAGLIAEAAASDDVPESAVALLQDVITCVPIGPAAGDVTPAAPVIAGEDDHADSPEEATPAAAGGSVEGVLGHPADRDMFVFEAEAGVLYRIDVYLETLSDSVLTLFDAAGEELAFNDDQLESAASRIEWEVPEPGDYYLAVAGWAGDTGAYTLVITPLPDDGDDPASAGDDHADTPEEATPAAVGEPVGGALNHEDDVDVFVFTAEAGARYGIDVILGTLDDSILTLHDADGTELAYNDDNRGAPASRIEWQAPEPGDYYLTVEGFVGDTGSYTLAIALIPDTDDHGDALPPDADATPAPVGGSIGGELHHEADIDVFVFTAEAGALYQIDVVLGTLDDSVLTLYDAGGEELAYNDDLSDSSYESRIEWEAPAAGDYYLAVEGYGGDTGSYALTIAVLAGG